MERNHRAINRTLKARERAFDFDPINPQARQLVVEQFQNWSSRPGEKAGIAFRVLLEPLQHAMAGSPPGDGEVITDRAIGDRFKLDDFGLGDRC
jgi:hypothetical protein